MGSSRHCNPHRGLSRGYKLPHSLQANWIYCLPSKLCPVAAAIARRVYLRQGLGVGALRTQFGNRNTNRGTRPEKHARAAGGVIRHILMQFEANNLMEKTTTAKGGRKMTPSGQRDLDLIASRIATAMAEEADE